MNSDSTSSGHGLPAATPLFTRLTVSLLLLFSLIIIAERTLLPVPPLGRDPAAYALISRELLDGKALYEDVWDHKPPAIFVVYGAMVSMFGTSERAFFGLNVVVTLISLLGIFFAGGLGPGQRSAAVIAAAFWAVLSGNLFLEGRDPNADMFLNACLIWAMAALIWRPGPRIGTRAAFAAGLCFAIGTLFKPVLLASAAFLALAYIVAGLYGGVRARHLLADCAMMAAVGALAWFAVVAYFAASGRLDVFVASVFSYNGYYSGDVISNILALVNGRGELFIDFLGPLPLLMAAGIAVTFFYDLRKALLILALAVSSWVAIALPGQFYTHYYQLWFPPIVIATAWALGFLARSEKALVRGTAYVAGVFALGLAIWVNVPSYQAILAEDWKASTDRPMLLGEEVAERVNFLLEPGETFFVWGDIPNLYLLAERRPPAAVVFERHLAGGPMAERLKLRVAEDLARERPEILVWQTNRRPVSHWVMADFDPTAIATVGDAFEIFTRRGGRLEQKLRSENER
ncbi:MAG TPA: hypothetical protein PKD24_13475 [Pyrinomonadaceae bacterium]|nr:hypothetical protein [Pyrinomonadaceae bacterium]HMP66304.1 hypothetical protein [Pyrinomonadaceae bacterium]